MSRLRLLGALLLVLSLWACKPEPGPEPEPTPTSKFELNFTMEWAGQAAYLGQAYRNPQNSDSVVLDALKFYVSNVRLVKHDGSELPVSDIHLYNFLNNSSVGKTTHLLGEGLRVDVPLGHYLGVRYNIGLTDAQNATDPTTVPSSSLLSDFQGMFWSWNSGYRFFLLEGRQDTLPSDGQSVFSHGLSWHYGGNDLRIEMNLTEEEHHFEVRAGQETQFIHFFDMVSVMQPFQTGLDSIQLRTENITHQSSVAETALSQKIKTNFGAALQTAISYTQL